MKQINLKLDNKLDLDKFLESKEIKQKMEESKSILVQVFVNFKIKEGISNIKNTIKIIKEKMPKAIVVGITTAGEIINGEIVENDSVISITFFKNTKLKSFGVAYNTKLKSFGLPYNYEKEEKIGENLGEQIASSYSNISGVLILAAILNPNIFINSLMKKIKNTFIFGGSASTGFDENGMEAMVFNGEEIFKQGLVVVVFSGENLHIEKQSYLGWEPLSRELTITKDNEDFLVKEIEGKTPFSIFEKYLGIRKNEYNFLNSLEFPILLEVNGEKIARVLVKYNEDGTVYGGWNFKKGDKFRIGYGDPNNIIKNAKIIHEKMKKFNPEVMLIYTSHARLVFLKEDEKLEIEPLGKISPIAGSYTYGELGVMGEDAVWQNLSMVVIGMREGEPKNNIECDEVEDEQIETINLSQMTLVSRLVHFIKAVVQDYEESQNKLEILSITDKLTGLNNRGKIDEILKEEMNNMKINKTNLSIVLLDIDHFKLVNDTYGHHIGDVVLKGIAKILKSNIRKKDSVGRWGGEEFMIILKDTSLENATHIAERIRKTINNYDFEQVGKISASFGVIEVNEIEDEIKALNRVDKALYEAKNTGRNKVVFIKYK